MEKIRTHLQQQALECLFKNIDDIEAEKRHSAKHSELLRHIETLVVSNTIPTINQLFNVARDADLFLVCKLLNTAGTVTISVDPERVTVTQLAKSIEDWSYVLQPILKADDIDDASPIPGDDDSVDDDNNPIPGHEEEDNPSPGEENEDDDEQPDPEEEEEEEEEEDEDDPDEDSDVDEEDDDFDEDSDRERERKREEDELNERVRQLEEEEQQRELEEEQEREREQEEERERERQEQEEQEERERRMQQEDEERERERERNHKRREREDRELERSEFRETETTDRDWEHLDHDEDAWELRRLMAVADRAQVIMSLEASAKPTGSALFDPEIIWVDFAPLGSKEVMFKQFRWSPALVNLWRKVSRAS